MPDFYEIVRIVSSETRPEYIGKEGYVAGKNFENDDHENGMVTGYGVFLFDIEKVVSVAVDGIVGSGKFVDPEDMYSGNSLRVKNDNGKGVIVPEEE
jgi:hypothetical protein